METPLSHDLSDDRPRDFADENPEANVIGTDISPIQPTWVPPNALLLVADPPEPVLPLTRGQKRSQIEDCTQEWTFPENEFDYVHIRYLIGSIADWTAFFKEAYKVLKPGGWLESFEPSSFVKTEASSPPFPTTSPVNQWGPLFEAGGKMIGRSFTVVEDDTQKKAMEAAGFVDVTVKEFKVILFSFSRRAITDRANA